MSERYSRLFSLPENLYVVGSPVVIEAGTLLKDTQTGRIVAQLKLRSISDKIIKAVKVKLDLYDTAGNSIEEPVVHNYLDLSISRDTEFAQKNPIPISNNTARSYKVSVTEVVFAGQSVWTAKVGSWEPLSKPSLLAFDDPELQKQYQIKFGRNSTYEPKSEKDLWYCTCGALNHEDEICHCCNNSLLSLQTADMVTLKAEKDARLEDQARQAEENAKRIAEEKAARDVAAKEAKKKAAKTLKIVIPVVCAFVAVALLVITVIIPNSKYNDAVAMMEAGQFEDALYILVEIENHKDSQEKIDECINAFIDECSDTYHKAKVFYELREHPGMWEHCMQQWGEITHRDTIGSGKNYIGSSDWKKYIVGLKADGTAETTKYTPLGIHASHDTTLLDFTDIVAVSVGKDDHHVVLREDGTAVAFGYNSNGAHNVSGWADIVAISAGHSHTVGLKADGTVVATKYTGRSYYGQCEVSEWTDIVAISTGYWHTVGLKSDGTVVATRGGRDYGESEVSDWTDIVAVSAGWHHTVGLKSDGTVVATTILESEELGRYDDGQSDVSEWTDIVAISAGDYHTLGLKTDGTVVYAGYVKDEYQSILSEWTDIVAINTNAGGIIGLKRDGTVVTVGFEDDDECDVSGWTDMKLPN